MLITIIIPIYNRAKTLPNCLDSIIQQEYSNFECLLIDDGSRDESLSICQEYASKDIRFRVFHKENGGVGAARNLGLDNTKGEWVAFVDSDDTIAPNHLSQFVSAIETATVNDQQGVDVVFCGCQYRCNRIKTRQDHIYNKAVYKGIDGIREFLSHTDVLQYMYACDRIYRRKLLEQNNIRFDTTLTLSEDRLLCYQFLKYVNGVATVSEATYIINEEDNNKLSQRSLSSEMCINRYEKLSTAMKEIASTYDVYNNGIIPFWSYNCALLDSMMHSLYNVKGNIFSAIKRQRYIFKKYFDFDFYNKIKDIPEVAVYNTADSQISRIINMQFLFYDLHILFHYILVRLHIKK